MTPGEVEISEIVIILHAVEVIQIAEALAGLKSAGVVISDVDEENGVVAGTIETIKVSGLAKLPFVKFVRNVFEYVDEPAKPADAEDNLPGEADDAGR